MISPEGTRRERVLLIQLARLGDLVQSLPAYVALRAVHPGLQIDLLCAAALAPVASLFPSIGRVLGWDGHRWREWERRWETESRRVREEVAGYFEELVPQPYDVAYNLNQHGRAILAAHLCAARVQGPGVHGALSTVLPPWAAYLRRVAGTRGDNRVHLADAFCGMCGVRPPVAPPRLELGAAELPSDLSDIGGGSGFWVAVAVGAGDAERVIPPNVWSRWIAAFLRAAPAGQVVLVGAGSEREAARAIQDGLTALAQGRVWDTTSRLSLSQLAICLQRCRWVIGADTGPVHLGAALGARAMGWYLARARVHETGPYGEGHVVWQAEVRTGQGDGASGSDDLPRTDVSCETPEQWPLWESVELMLTGACGGCPPGWSLWRSRFDNWGTWYAGAADAGSDTGRQRERVWRAFDDGPAEVAS